MAPLVPVSLRVRLAVRAHARTLLVFTAAIVGLTALAIVSRAAAAAEAAAGTLRVLAVGYGVILAVRLVASDLEQGAVQLWLQKPVDPVRYYLGRVGEAFLALVTLLTLAALAARSVAGGVGWEGPDVILVALPGLLVEGAVVVCLAFAASAWLTRGGAVLVAALVLSGLAFDDTLALRPELLAQPWNGLVRAALYPELAFRSLHDLLLGGPDASPLAVLRIGGYAAAWLLIGVVGVRRAVNGGGVARAQGG